MRITAEAKAETRKRILDAAKHLFRTRGFEQATTRDIGKKVGIATGTMFNYFGSKEAIVVELAAQAFTKSQREFAKHRRGQATADEELFSLIATQLRHLRSLRSFIRPLLDTALTPVAPPKQPEAVALRIELNEQFAQILVDHGFDDPTAVQLSILWALYVGVLTMWGNDKSPKQEDTLAMLDQSLRMFVDWLGAGTSS